jgi:lipoprotein-anchoring transpeptidase ErfK/SrfK
VWHEAGIHPTRRAPMLVGMKSIAALGALALVAAGLTGCSGRADAATVHGYGRALPAAAAPAKNEPAAPPVITGPADGSTNVSTATELSLTGGRADSAAAITLTDASGATVPGTMRADGSSWIPSAQLKYATAYTAAVAGGAKVSFTTMAKPAKTVSTTVSMKDGATYGVAMPIVVTFGSAVPADQRAAVEKRLLVTSDPPQLGVWNWFSGTEVHYRPKNYWSSGTKLAVRLATGGLNLGKGLGARDVTVNAAIGDKIVMTTDDKTHTMTVTQNDQVIKQIPISLGKASTPSSSGNMVVMTKAESEEFVSTDPSDPYKETVYWTQRLTWSGQFLHAAPWSVGSQGKRNVSHGCTNMSTANAKWLWNLTHIGDPVTVSGTPRKLDWGNGWTDWNKDWAAYVKGSALPAPADPSGPAPATSPAPAAGDDTPAWSGGMDTPG